MCPGFPDSSRAAHRLEATSDGPAAWIAARLRIFPSLFVSWIVANVGALVIASVMIGLGLLTTRVLFSVEAIENADEWLPAWAEDQRTPFRTDLSKIASNLGDVVLILTAGVAIARTGPSSALADGDLRLQAGLVEALVYLLVANAIARPRPAVEPLDNLNPTHSFPSGHVAASVAVYGAIALLLTAHFRQALGADRNLDGRERNLARRRGVTDLPG